MGNSLDKITIKGFKSIKEVVDLDLTNLNVIVGANGAGKSNLISFFKLLSAFIHGNLDKFILESGGAGDFLFNGRKVTEELFFELNFGDRGLRFKLKPTPNDTFFIQDEARYYSQDSTGWWELGDSSDGKSSMVKEIEEARSDAKYSKPVYNAISSWQCYHFHDSSQTAGMRHYEIIQDIKKLRMDAANIAPFLLKLKDESISEYREIINAIRMVMPFFDDFILDPVQRGPKTVVNLSWNQKGSDYPMQPYHFSDGSIRFICLAVALLQPNPPSTIIIDEPELGLHPAAISILAELIQVASKKTQVIIATQSPTLMNQFSIENILVVNRENGSSTFNRLKESDFSEWLEKYSIGELWEKNVISGGPTYE